MSSDEASDGGVLDDTIGAMIKMKTHNHSKKLRKHTEQIDQVKKQLASLELILKEKVNQQDHASQLATIKAETGEAVELARSVRFQSSALAPQMRDELLKLTRDEMAAGTTALHALANSHTATMAELQRGSSDQTGRLAALELQVRSAEAAQRERGDGLDSRLADASTFWTEKLEKMQRELVESKVELDSVRKEAAVRKQENEESASSLEKITTQAMASNQAMEQELGLMRSQISTIMAVLEEHLGVQVSELQCAEDTSQRGMMPTTVALGGPASTPNASPNEASSTTKHALAPTAVAAVAVSPSGTAAATRNRSGVHSGAIVLQIHSLKNDLEQIKEQASCMQTKLEELGSVADTSLLIEGKVRAALWNEQVQTDRISKLEAALSTLAPNQAVVRLDDVVAQAAETASRLSALEETSAARDAAGREALLTAQMQQDDKLGRRTDERVKQAEAEVNLKIAQLNMKLDHLSHVAETGHTSAEAAMQTAQQQADHMRNTLRERLQDIRDETHSSCEQLLHSYRSEISALDEKLTGEFHGWRQDLIAKIGELTRKNAVCWEGMRENRVELANVMRTLHHLVERSEIQHVVNQMVTRAAYANLAAYGGGSVGTGGRYPLTSPRVGLNESSPGHASTGPPPHLPQAIQLNHRKCLKKGECSCADRLSATLGAGDPRLALDRLFEKQIRLLLNVRASWQQAEAVRGELPYVPHLPPLPQALPMRVPWDPADRR